MKLITIILISLIALSLQADRVEKATSKAQKNKNTKTSRTQTGVKTAMARIFTVTMTVDGAETASKGTLDAKEIKKPVDDRVRGLFFTLSEKLEDLNNVLIQKGDKWVLPYRQLSAPFVVNTPNDIGKFLTTTIQIGEKEFRSLKIQFEHDPDWDVITNDEITNLAQWLNANRESRITIVSNLKNELQLLANEYYTNKKNGEAADKGAEGIKKQIEDSNANITNLTKLNGDDKKTYTTVEKSIADKENAIAKFKAAQADASNKMAQYDTSLASNQEILDGLKNQKNSGVADKGANEGNLLNSRNAFEASIARLKLETYGDVKLFDQSATELFTNFNLSLCTSNLRSAFKYIS